jgi:hypothetical protein
MTETYGHMTLIDGSHVPLANEEAEALWKVAEQSKANRADAMPTAQDALRALIQAEERLRELGWWRGGGLRVRRGDKCAVAAQGSTGIWSGRLDADGTFVDYVDAVSKRDKVFLKPLDQLSDDERQHMEECDRQEAAAFTAMMGRMAEQEPTP